MVYRKKNPGRFFLSRRLNSPTVKRLMWMSDTRFVQGLHRTSYKPTIQLFVIFLIVQFWIDSSSFLIFLNNNHQNSDKKTPTKSRIAKANFIEPSEDIGGVASGQALTPGIGLPSTCIPTARQPRQLSLNLK